MIPRECKRLAEVDFPIAVVSKHAVREKSIRHGHPSTLHLWWARRPLASSRAMLLALLLPDPCDPHCPPEFKTRARGALEKVQKVGAHDDDLQRGLLRFIGDFANWDLAANARYLEAGRGLVRAAYPDEPPLVVDPFAGGGSIPLEALRLGCQAFAGDLNPVACLILKVLLEDIPRHGPKLADDLRRAGKEIKEEVQRELARFYPPDPDGALPIAYLWARTVRCDTPGCGAEIPLVRSCWLSKKAHRRRAIRYRATKREGQPPEIELDIIEPETEGEVQKGTVSNAKATCPACNFVLGSDRLRAQLSEHRGGADVVFDDDGCRIGGARLLAVVLLREGEQGRQYRSAEHRDYVAVFQAKERVADVTSRPMVDGLSAIPDEPINPVRPSPNARGMSAVTRYGVATLGDLFTARQKLAHAELGHAVGGRSGVTSLLLGRMADYNSSCCRWVAQGEFIGNTFTRHALSLVWDFCEVNPLSPATGGLDGAIEWVERVIAAMPKMSPAETALADAAELPLPDESASVVFTDPPYYDAIPYSDLSDFFFVWLRRAHPDDSRLRDPFDASNPLTPKTRESVWNRAHVVDGQSKDARFYEKAMASAFKSARQTVQSGAIGSVVFAHQTTEGWEALLGGLVKSEWTITASWPVATEMPTRARARDNASLATSVHLVCRPRLTQAVGDWADVLRELPQRVGDWIQRLQAEGVRGADLVFACIGPALEIYSRYARVETADGRDVPLAEYLEKVWEVVGRAALNQVLGSEGNAGALEEDARLVALFLWTLQSTAGLNGAKDEDEEEEEDAVPADDDADEDSGSGRKAKGYTLVYDVVRRFAQPLGIHLEDWERRIIETKKGTVRLLPVSERAKQLFGEDGAHAAADQLETPGASPQLSLFPEVQAVVKPKRGKKIVVTAGDDVLAGRRGATTLDRLHAAMLLQASGRSNALRSLLLAEVDRGPEFLRLANSLSALYPRDSEEKRLIDAMLLAAPR